MGDGRIAVLAKALTESCLYNRAQHINKTVQFCVICVHKQRNFRAYQQVFKERRVACNARVDRVSTSGYLATRISFGSQQDSARARECVPLSL